MAIYNVIQINNNTVVKVKPANTKKANFQSVYNISVTPVNKI